MKVCVHYPNLKRSDSFEGARLRKTLKGACESMGVTWEDEPSSSTDIAHFLSPLDEPLLVKCKEKGIKTILSCFYCENDPIASFLEKKKGVKEVPQNAVRMMNEADVVLVPTEEFASKARQIGASGRIVVMPPGVNLARFSSKSVESDIFPRYFRVPQERKFAVCLGSYDDKKAMSSLIKLATLTPKMYFYFFGTKKTPLLRFTLSSLQKKAPKNLVYQPIVQDDVYRSALMHCCCYLLLDDEHSDQMGLLDAFASGAEVVAIGDQKVNPVLKNGENCLLFRNEEGASKALSRLYLEKDKAIIMAGYGIAESCALPVFAKQLFLVYEETLQKESV